MLFAEDAVSCELTVEIYNGDIQGGGLPKSSYVEVDIDGDVIFTTPEAAPPYPVWNRRCVKLLPSLEQLSHSTVNIVVHKKRWTASGYKEVGRVSIPFTELRMQLNMKLQKYERALTPAPQNVTLKGAISYGVELHTTEDYVFQSFSNHADDDSLNSSYVSFADGGSSNSGSYFLDDMDSASQQNSVDDSVAGGFGTGALSLGIYLNRATIFGGGLQNSAFVEVSFDGKVYYTSEDTYPPEWNVFFVIELRDYRPSSLLKFTVWKKRWTSSGHKVVGTISFAMSTLKVQFCNKGRMRRWLDLVPAERNVTLTGSLSFDIELTDNLMLHSTADHVHSDDVDKRERTESEWQMWAPSGGSGASCADDDDKGAFERYWYF